MVFANAGIAQFEPAEHLSEVMFDKHFNTNVKGPAFLVKEAIPNLNEGGNIIFNTSIVHQKGFEGSAIYSASKGALRAYARVLTTELASKKIRVNSIAPGPIETPIYAKMEGMNEQQMQEMSNGFSQMIPLKRFGNSKEVADTVMFLASHEASFINGIEIEVDGGLSQI